MHHDISSPAAGPLFSMPVKRAGQAVATLLAFGFMIGVFVSVASASFGQASSVPDNAHARSYGDGWECDRSFRREGAACAPVVVPDNAYATQRTYGAGWECLHGYRETVAGTCLKVIVPDGGYLAPSGADWSCLRGYEKRNAGCVAVDLPDHAYLSDSIYGSAWACERGYEVVGDACQAVVVPEHGYLNTAGYGQSWNCERGYAASGDRCIAVILPANAHLDRTGNRWACNKNFQRSQGQCVLNK